MTIIPASASKLFEARFAIDGPHIDNRELWEEVEEYVQGIECRRAFIALDRRNKILGYIECKLEETGLPPGAPPVQGLEKLGHIARLGVREEDRGKKIGTKLLEEAERWLRSMGRSGAWLDFHSQNVGAIKLYTRGNYLDEVAFPDKKPGNKEKRLRVIAKKTWAV